jgi:hypothetical protein
MNTTPRDLDETRLAEDIVSVLEPAALRACSDARDVVRYAVRSAILKLRSVILSRVALRRLIDDPARSVKIDYLKRDLLRSATHRVEYRYPRTSGVRAKTETAMRKAAGTRF